MRRTLYFLAAAAAASSASNNASTAAVPNFVSALLVSGRVVDIPLRHFAMSQYERTQQRPPSARSSSSSSPNMKDSEGREGGAATAEDVSATSTPHSLVRMAKAVREAAVAQPVPTAAAWKEAAASVLEEAAAVPGQEDVLCAAALSGILMRIERACALHLTHAIRWDGLALRSPAMQERLAHIATWRYGLESLLEYVAGTFRHASASAPGRDALLEPLMLRVFAEMALTNAVEASRDMLHGCVLEQSVPHRSSTSATTNLVVDYPYLDVLLQGNALEIATGSTTTLCQRVEEHVFPLLRGAGGAGGVASRTGLNQLSDLVSSLVGMTSGSGGAAAARLSSSHINLQKASKTIEKDASALLAAIPAHRNSTDALWGTTLAKLTAELFADIAVLHRCSAALHCTGESQTLPLAVSAPRDTHRETLLGAAFHAFSHTRRTTLLKALELEKESKKEGETGGAGRLFSMAQKGSGSAKKKTA